MVGIDAKKFLAIMKSNFDCPIINTWLGDGIEMNNFSAFIFSCLTGAGYLEDPLFPFSPKGLMKVFYSALDYSFVTGLFNNGSFHYTPYRLYLQKKWLFEGKKIIIPVEFNKETYLQKKLEKFLKVNKEIKGTDFLIFRIEKSKKGNGMEPFLEYLCAMKFKENGYLIETQAPLNFNHGTPDFGGYKIMAFNAYLNKHKLPLGLFLVELSMLRLKWLNTEKYSKEILNYDQFIVGEAKTSTKKMETQLLKYLDTHFFNEAYELYPEKIQLPNPNFGLVYIDVNNKTKMITPKDSNTFLEINKQKEYSKWLSNYVKYYLVANLTNDEFNDFYFKIAKKKTRTKEDTINFINNLTYDQIFSKIKEAL